MTGGSAAFDSADIDEDEILSKEELEALTLTQIYTIAGVKGYSVTADDKPGAIAQFLEAQADVKFVDADENSDDELSEDELKALNKAQILALATDLGYTTVLASMTKTQMITAFLAAQAAAADDT